MFSIVINPLSISKESFVKFKRIDLSVRLYILLPNRLYTVVVYDHDQGR